uniref:C-type lectin domain-containing protein n=1 Tax=Knipowitschia caucasica TaxID=637954 RepID=A0AAV2JMJ8_KNICA
MFSSLGHGTIFFTFAHDPIEEYYFINQSKSWSEAQQYCREHFTDLATIERKEDLSRVHIPAGQVAWIGLHDDPAAWFQVMTNASNSWRWSPLGPPALEASRTGLHLSQIIGMAGIKQFFRMTDFLRTWFHCQTECRKSYQDLAQIETAEEKQAAMAAMTGTKHAWIGLYRNTWLWSDLSNSTFRNWKTGSPNNINNNEHCVHMNEHCQMDDATCSEPQKFVCHEGIVSQRL